MADEAKNTTDKKDDVSKAEAERLAEFRRTRKVPSGYTYNVRDGLHKTPKKGK